MMSLSCPAWSLWLSRLQILLSYARQTHSWCPGLLVMMSFWFQEYCVLGSGKGCQKTGISNVNSTSSSRITRLRYQDHTQRSHPKQILKISIQEMAPSALNRKREWFSCKTQQCSIRQPLWIHPSLLAPQPAPGSSPWPWDLSVSCQHSSRFAQSAEISFLSHRARCQIVSTSSFQKTLAACLFASHGFWESNPGLRVCAASTLSNEPFS